MEVYFIHPTTCMQITWNDNMDVKKYTETTIFHIKCRLRINFGVFVFIRKQICTLGCNFYQIKFRQIFFANETINLILFCGKLWCWTFSFFIISSLSHHNFVDICHLADSHTLKLVETWRNLLPRNRCSIYV